ncbi:amidohydrolase 2 [Cavenderia fasciculata]|uniref:Amidohydrolase 2 n=1 Tax=Cavenderia fasciculata TaxID=261658 RepID=F4Q5C9_CACFS|nr:amidohydrolase 2 [Cavenderia fasciculata]EGG17188.1 amidohydrolase 2 [Cavenderia fasciculata]|eukprot:XP_004355672.1 amidohydrolase 2 [Cavenderia fasciculata]
MVLDWLSSKIGGNFNNNNNNKQQREQQQVIESNLNDHHETIYQDSSFASSSYDNIMNDGDRGHPQSSLPPIAATGRPRATEVLSVQARQMLDTALEPFIRSENGCIVDHMVNLFGIGEETNCTASKQIRDRFSHPIKYLKFKAFTSACAITDLSQWDRQYVIRLVQLLRELKSHYPFGKSLLSSLDKRYDENGIELLNQTGLYVPNDYLMDIIHDFPDLFLPSISIHPYRKDSVDELLKWIVQGVRYVRWMPVSMGIDPSSPLCDNFYEALVENDIILALDKGVKVVGVHCGAEGKSYDYDDTSGKSPPPLIPNLHLFLRLMHEPKYEKLLIGDIGGVVAYHRVDALVPLLDHQHIHDRLIFSSDYPIPAVNLAVITTLLANRGLIHPDERDLVNEIYRFNPILFDFVLKRILKSPITGNTFKPSVFKENSFFSLNSKNGLMGTPNNTSSSNTNNNITFSPKIETINNNQIISESSNNNNINNNNNNNTPTKNTKMIPTTFIYQDDIDIFSQSPPTNNNNQYEHELNQTTNLIDDFSFSTSTNTPTSNNNNNNLRSSMNGNILTSPILINHSHNNNNNNNLHNQFLTEDDLDEMEEYTDF